MKQAALDAWVRKQEGLSCVTRQDLETLQLKKLNQLLKREKERGGFYGNLPFRLDSLEEVKELPFTTEEDLRREGNRMVLLSQSLIERVRTETTSGTTGTAKRIYYSEEDQNRTVSFFAAGLSELVHKGEKTMICMPFSGARGLGELISEAVCQLEATPVKAGIGRTYGELLDILEEEKPETFVGMPIPLLSLLRLKPKNSLQRALISADVCPKGIQKEIEMRLGSRLYPHYGSREMGLAGAVTCPAFQGMHLRENDILAEIVDKAGNPLPAGCWGELVITTLQAEAMPLIRYRTGDYTRFYAEPCPCGSVLHRLDQVSRMEQGQSMAELDEKLFSASGVIDYQTTLTKKGILVEGYGTAPLEMPGISNWRGYPVEYRWRLVKKEDKPCYLGKRRIL